MSKAGKRIVASAKEAHAYVRGEAGEGFRVHIPDEIDVRAVRRVVGLIQEQFARRIGVSVATLRNWEQGRRVPEGPARVLLAMLKKRPTIVEETLGTAA
jgi:putative transcriptional regulator